MGTGFAQMVVIRTVVCVAPLVPSWLHCNKSGEERELVHITAAVSGTYMSITSFVSLFCSQSGQCYYISYFLLRSCGSDIFPHLVKIMI